MELNHITEKSCIDCGAKVVRETRKDKHTNGLWNEYKEYQCGKIVHFIPNYGLGSEPRVETQCPKTKKNRLKAEKRVNLKLHLIEVIEDSDADEEYKKTLIVSIKYR